MKLQRQDEELLPVVTFLEQGLLPPEESIARQLLLRNVGMWFWTKCCIGLMRTVEAI